MTRAQFVPSTLNEEARTIEIVAATDRAVRMYDWWEGSFNEILSLEDGHMMTERLNNGLPFLNNHNRYEGAFGVYGVVESWRIENNQLIATVRFADDEDSDKIYQKIKSGIVRGISIGYNVYQYEEVRTGDDQLPTFRAVLWEPTEISTAPIQADTASTVRSADKQPTHEILIRTAVGAENLNPNTMKREQLVALLQKRGIAFDDNATDQELFTALERALEAKPQGNDDAAIRAAITQERERVAAIRKAVADARLKPEFAESFISEGTSVEDVRTKVIEEFGKQDPNAGQCGHVHVGREQNDKERASILESLEFKAGLTREFKQGGRDFMGASMRDLAALFLERAGIDPRSHMGSKDAIFRAALGRTSGLHTTSDFPIVLADVMNKTLRAAYEAAPRTFTGFCRRETAPDFRDLRRTQISGLVGDLEVVPEGGEYKRDTMTEAQETYKVAKYGKVIGLSYEAMVNDDLGAFSRVAQAVADAAASKQSDIIYAILTGNPNMSDGNALFSVAHGNIAGAASVIDVANMGLAIAKMRKQKGLDGKFINVQPAYLIVGADRELQAAQLINSTIVPNTTGQANPYANSVQLVVDPRIEGNKWYLAAAPSRVDTIEYAFLDGEELFTERREGFDVDGEELKVRMVFGAKAIDWRGLQYNAGA